jgi:ABC-type antimicrobial peptide transport system permease subunit
MQIVGLVQNAKYHNMRETVPPTFYEPISGVLGPRLVFSVKTSVPPISISSAVSAAISGIDKNTSFTIRTFQSQIDDSLVQERLIAMLSAFFGTLALFIAAAGLAGLVSYSVSRRRAELGIRAALGATPRSLVRLVMREVLLITGAGLVFGWVLSFAGGRFVASMLYQVSPDDPITLAKLLLRAHWFWRQPLPVTFQLAGLRASIRCSVFGWSDARSPELLTAFLNQRRRTMVEWLNTSKLRLRTIVRSRRLEADLDLLAQGRPGCWRCCCLACSHTTWQTLALCVTLLATTGLIAAYLPARGASRLDPMTVLREEWRNIKVSGTALLAAIIVSDSNKTALPLATGTRQFHSPVGPPPCCTSSSRP